MSKQTTPINAPKIQLNEVQLMKLLDNQAKQLEIQEKELQLRAIELEKGYNYSEKALEANKEILLKEQENKGTETKNQYFFIGGLSTLFIGGVIYLSFIGHSKIAEDLMKMLIPVASAGAVLLYQKTKNKSNNNSEE